MSTFVPNFLHGLDQLRSDDRYAAPAPPQLEPHVELTLAWAPFWGVPLACLDPARRAQSSTFLPAPVRRKQAQHISSPSRTGGGVFGRCRCAPRPDALGWPSPSPRRSHLLARRRTARDSLNGIGRARAASMLSRHELSHRAFFPACTFGLRCRGLWRCVVVVSSRASESVVVCTCVFRTD